MKILIIGAGNMGSWLVEALCLDHEVGVYDQDKKKLKFLFNSHRFTNLKEISEFCPDMTINAVSLQHTFTAFEAVLDFLPQNCILSDIASVKNGLFDFYKKSNRRFVSTHPMFGPTFANIKDLSEQNAIIIKESDEEGKKFFYDFYKSFNINIFEYSFEEHDRTIAYSLSTPFVSTLVFASCIKKQEAPGTTFKKHMTIARGLLSENDYLLSEVLFSPFSLDQITAMQNKLAELKDIVEKRDTKRMHKWLENIRKNIE